jgi:GxxExxY protein
MNNGQRWSIIKTIRMQTPEVLAQKAEAKLAREAARAEAKAQKEAEKERLKAEKAAVKAAQPPKKRGRPKAVKPTETAPEGDMAPYEKLDLLRSFAEEVYASLGAGHLESIYHAAMEVELRIAGMQYESEQIMPVTHKGTYVGTIRADIIVAKECVLEFKISGKLEDAKQQARQYMKLQGIKYGFVVMFPKVDGGKVQFVDARVVDEE